MSEEVERRRSGRVVVLDPSSPRFSVNSERRHSQFGSIEHSSTISAAIGSEKSASIHVPEVQTLLELDEMNITGEAVV